MRRTKSTLQTISKFSARDCVFQPISSPTYIELSRAEQEEDSACKLRNSH